METMPSDVLNRGIVIDNLSDGGIFGIFEFVFFNVPNANFFIGLSRKKNVVVDGIPSKAIAF
jgi:hypothetical protein